MARDDNVQLDKNLNDLQIEASLAHLKYLLLFLMHCILQRHHLKKKKRGKKKRGEKIVSNVCNFKVQ